MILDTLELIAKRLEEFLQNRLRGEPRGSWVILSDIVDQEGAVIEQAKDKLVMFLANLQRETIVSTFNGTRRMGGNDYAAVTPPQYIDLFLLFYANFSGTNYKQGLRVISQTIEFFQQYPSFDQQDLPGLNPSIEKLRFDLTNLDLTDANYLMGLAGAKYLPSVYYKVQTIPFSSDAVRARIPEVSGVESPEELESLSPEEPVV